jgi:pantetheine-phosphate adenylyltransferase
MSGARCAVYAGTFDPLTLGHLDLAERAARTFDRLVLAVARDTKKHCLFDVEERCAMAAASLAHVPQVEVVAFSGLLVDWAREQGIKTLVRGLRAFSDFEYEFQMALTNRKLAPDVETLFLMPCEDFSYVSSSMVKEIASLGGDVDRFVPAPVADALRARFA